MIKRTGASMTNAENRRWTTGIMSARMWERRPGCRPVATGDGKEGDLLFSEDTSPELRLDRGNGHALLIPHFVRLSGTSYLGRTRGECRAGRIKSPPRVPGTARRGFVNPI